MVDQCAGIGLAEAGLDLFDMPVLDVTIRGDGFVEQVTPVTIQGLRQSVERTRLVGVDPKAESLLVYMTR